MVGDTSDYIKLVALVKKKVRYLLRLTFLRPLTLALLAFRKP